MYNASKMGAYRRNFDETKYMCFLIENNELLEKQNEIWNKVSNAIKKGFDSESVYSEKYLKTKIKSFEGRTNINFHNDKTKKKFIHCL